MTVELEVNMDSNKDTIKTKFLKLLSQEINSGSNKYTFNGLSVYLVEAIKNLPDGYLKDGLSETTKESSEYLWSLLKESKKSTEILFNVFNKLGLEETLKNIKTLKSSKEQLFYLSQAGLCFPSKDVFDAILKAKTAESAKQNKLKILIEVTELCGRLTVGCSNSEVLHGLMHIFLSEAGNIFENLKESQQSDDSWVNLKKALLGILVHCHLKGQKKRETFKDIDLRNYRDLLAAILSLYIDVLVMIGEGDESTLNHLSNMVYILLGDSPAHVLDTVNQISTLNESSVEVVLPFLRKVLLSSQICRAGIINYIKYISAAWRVLRLIARFQKDNVTIKKVVGAVLPPEGVLTWIEDKSDSLVKNLNLSGLTGGRITEQLLQCESEETMDDLLDLVSGLTEETLSHTNILVESEKDMRPVHLDECEESPLFFLDSQGDSELVEQCQEDEFSNSKSDQIVKKQIDAMLGKLQASSDEENEYDVSFEIDEPETIQGFININDGWNQDGNCETDAPVETISDSPCTEDNRKTNSTVLDADSENPTQKDERKRKRKRKQDSASKTASTKVKTKTKTKIVKKTKTESL